VVTADLGTFRPCGHTDTDSSVPIGRRAVSPQGGAVRPEPCFLDPLGRGLEACCRMCHHAGMAINPNAGVMHVRLPRSLADALKLRAETEGVSINLLIATLLAGAMDFSLSEKE
jgi:HicB family